MRSTVSAPVTHRTTTRGLVVKNGDDVDDYDDDDDDDKQGDNYYKYDKHDEDGME